MNAARKFSYKAFDPAGQPVTGMLEMGGEEEVNKYFIENSLIPVAIKEEKTHAWFSSSNDFFISLSRKLLDNELIAFTRQFAAAYGAGLAVPRAMRMLSQQLTHPWLKKALASAAFRIEQGKGLTESLRGFPKVFDSTFLAIVGTGEVSGSLDQMLNYAALLLEKRLLNRERLKSTFLYPKLVLTMIAVTVFILIVFVIPQFAKIYDRFNATLPGPTLALIAISEGCKHYWWSIFILIPAALFGAHRLRQNEPFMSWLHSKYLNFPVFGSLIIKLELMHFCTTFSTLLKAGVKVTDAAENAIEGMGNRHLKKLLQEIKPHLEQGGTVSDSFSRVSVIPPLMTSMVAMGEEAGKMEVLLEKAAQLYENETDLVLKRLPTLIEPIILSLLFCVVLGLAIAVYLPLWQMTSLVKTAM